MRTTNTSLFFLSLSLGAPLAPSISGGGIKFVYEKYFVYLIHAARRFCFLRVEQTEEREMKAPAESNRETV
jgi:hypothetical protein